MSGASSIEWTDQTWNPVRGCSMAPGSEAGGCLNCYAARMAARNLPGLRSPTTGKNFARMLGAGPRWTGEVELIPEVLDWPLRRRKPLRIFVNSTSDLFHEKLSDEAIAAVFGVMAACPQHTFQILTKRPERMAHWFKTLSYMPLDHTDFEVRQCIGAFDRLTAPDARKHVNYPTWPLPNVWLGTSVENQATADERIPHLLATPAAKHFASYEPALGPVDFRRYLVYAFDSPDATRQTRLDWVIVGGESGPGARPFDLAWARSTVAQCRTAGVAPFVKQLGARPYSLAGDHFCADGSVPEGCYLWLHHSKGGDWNEWPEDLRVREFPR